MTAAARVEGGGALGLGDREYEEVGAEDEELEDEELEYDEALDDRPMRVRGRVFLGSVDAAANDSALRDARVGRVLSLLTGEERDQLSGALEGERRATLEMADSEGEDLLAALPGVLDTLRRLMCGRLDRLTAGVDD